MNNINFKKVTSICAETGNTTQVTYEAYGKMRTISIDMSYEEAARRFDESRAPIKNFNFKKVSSICAQPGDKTQVTYDANGKTHTKTINMSYAEAARRFDASRAVKLQLN